MNWLIGWIERWIEYWKPSLPDRCCIPAAGTRLAGAILLELALSPSGLLPIEGGVAHDRYYSW